MTKGKGSLIGMEDYFEFNENSKTYSKNVKINNQKNGRRHSGMCRDLDARIFKIDKTILDEFLEGYSGFRSFFTELAY